jgi:hypothetical protein
MRPRIASKIVKRVLAGEATHSSYPLSQVKRAFAMRKVELTEEHMRPWTEHQAEQARLAKEREEMAPTWEARRKARDERTQARIKAKEEHRKLIAQKEAERLAAAEAQQVVAVEAAKAAFKEAVANEVDELPESVEMTTEDMAASVDKNPEPDYASMTVGDLKALAKERGLLGYSGMKKADLIDLLSGQ